MRSITTAVLGIVAAVTLGTPAFAQCDDIKGKSTEYVISPFGSPNDPFGRTTLSTQGAFKAIGTAILTTVGPGPNPGTLGATTRHVFVVSEQDQLNALGVVVFTPIPNTPDVSSSLTLTVAGGTGKYAGASGTIVAIGTGFNFFPLPPGPSSTNVSTFQYALSGQVCVP